MTVDIQALALAQRTTYYFMAEGGVGITPDGTVPEGAVPCTQAQYQNPNQYFIDYSTTPPSIKSVDVATSLQLAQSKQIMALAASCSNAIYSGYRSLALGSAHLYPAKATDQMNMLSSLVAGLGSVVFDADDWEPNTNYVEGQVVWKKKQLYQVMRNGRSGAQEPLWPQSLTAPAVDGTVLWALWYTPFWCEDLSTNPGSWAFRPHTLRQIWQVGKDAKEAVLEEMGMNTLLVAQVMAAKTVEAVEAVKWP
jgi:hypothetical protein